MKTFNEWSEENGNNLTENSVESVFSAVTNPAKLKEIEDIIEQHPDLLQKIEKLKLSNQQSFDKSVDNFNRNSVNIRHLQKLANGSLLTWTDWM